MELKQYLMDASRYPIKCPYLMTPRGITIHNTDNDASAENEGAYMIRRPEEVSFHICVDEKEARQFIPFNRNSWANGDGNGTGNRETITMEIARNFGDSETFTKCQNNAAEIVAQLLKQFGWTINNIYTHRDWSGKNCPSRTDISKFKLRVQQILDGNIAQLPSGGGANTSIKVGDKVKVIGNVYATGQNIPYWVKTNAYTVVEVSGNKVLLDSIYSWVYASDVSLVSSSTGGSSNTSSGSVVVGSKVKVVGSNYATGQSVPDWVKANTYSVTQITGNRALLSDIISWVNISDLRLSGSTSSTPTPKPPASNNKYLNLKPHMQKWAIYNQNGPYTTAYKIGDLKPSQFGGISYEILGNPATDVYLINTRDWGRVAIWAPRDNDSTITGSPQY